ncbi:MAG TPA: hypothetical protein RMH99_04475, partial [Sandaracinaceae bacterium LLY-WYZ-13_1]|nr:hypothetical protein [Sandaracinaceae bacterium LLY-WYZ-13_1]
MSADRPKGGDEPLPAELRALLDEGRREALRPEAKAAIRARVPERVSPAPWKLAAGGGVILAVALGVAFWPRGGTPDRPAASGPAVEDAASVGGGRGPDGEVVPDGAGRAARGAEAAPDGPLPSNAGREPRRSVDECARAI